MTTTESTIVSRLWNYCNVLRDDGVSYGDYVEQLTFLLFLKMAHEQTRPPFNRPSAIPAGYDWPALLAYDGPELETHYRETLTTLGKEKGLLGLIFRKAQNKIQDPAKLRRLIKLIDDENWMGLDMDVKGAIYEGLLQKNAEDVKGGAGQYFTPRELIRAMVEVTRPAPMQTVCDPACGTGGFILAANQFIADPNNYRLDRDQQRFLRYQTFRGWEIVDSAARLCAMNLFLHGIGGDPADPNAAVPITVGDSLMSDPGEKFDLVLTNPPFGKKSSITVIGENGKADRDTQIYERGDFLATTSNKQLNFLQHIKTLLKINGQAAVVVPDNVLFEGGAGETIRRGLLSTCDVHTLLRLPTGIFYAQGVKANVLFFDKKPASETAWTQKLWIYDLRTNMHFTLRTNPLRYDDLQDFIRCYNPANRHDRVESDRFRAFSYADLVARDKASLDIFWLKDDSLEDSENLPDPDTLALEIVENLEAALVQFRGIVEDLGEELPGG